MQILLGLLYAFFWVVPRLLNFHMPTFRYVPAYEDGTVRSETSAYKIQTPENYPEEGIQRSEHGKSLKSRILLLLLDP